MFCYDLANNESNETDVCTCLKCIFGCEAFTFGEGAVDRQSLETSSSWRTSNNLLIIPPILVLLQVVLHLFINVNNGHCRHDRSSKRTLNFDALYWMMMDGRRCQLQPSLLNSKLDQRIMKYRLRPLEHNF